MSTYVSKRPRLGTWHVQYEVMRMCSQLKGLKLNGKQEQRSLTFGAFY